ncbi:MAG: chemotaxis protein CheW, partial [Anaeromyxobacteraceae bacterium]
MDFLEIRRKAKERAASRAPAVAPPAAPSIAAAPAVSLAFSGPAADCDPSLSALAAEGLSFTRLPDEAPPDLEPGEGSKPEERLPPAPRWPVMVDGGPLVEALREELGTERLAPAAAPTASAPASAPAPAAAPAAPAADPSAPDPTCAPAPTSAPLRAVPSEPDPLADFFYDEAEIAPGLEGLRVGAAPIPAVQAEAREYLTFLLGSEEYAVEIERVREVLKAPAVTEVPRA